ncbi:MAG TPA: hypothetical protein VGC21_12100 [Telluria sp.]|jgi:hypothetical protein
MYATVALKRNFEWGNIVLSQLPPAAQIAAVPAQWRIPISIEERSLNRVFLGEYLFNKKRGEDAASEVALHDDLAVWVWWSITAPLIQNQANTNWLASVLVEAVATLDVDYPQLPSALKQTAAAAKAKQDAASRFEAYNLAGRLELQSEMADWGSYAVRWPTWKAREGRPC